MANLMEATIDNHRDHAVGYIDQYIFTSNVLVAYMSGVAYNSGISYFKNFVSDTGQQSLMLHYGERGYGQVIGWQSNRGTLAIKVNKIPNTDMSRFIIYRKRGDYVNGKKINYVQARIEERIFFKLSDIIDDLKKAYDNIPGVYHSNGDTLERTLDVYNPSCRRFINSYLKDNCELIKKKACEIIKKNVNFPFLDEWISYLIKEEVIDIKTYSARYADLDNPNNVYVVSVGFYTNSLENAIQTGLSKKEISINGTNEASDKFNDIDTLTDYLQYFSSNLIDKASNKFSAIFDPSKEEFNNKEKDYFQYAQHNSKLQFFNTQKNVIAAVSRSLNKNRSALVVGEMGKLQCRSWFNKYRRSGIIMAELNWKLLPVA